MDVADLITEFGAYYIDQGQNLQSLAQTLYYTSETDALFTPIDTDNTVYRRSSSSMSRVLQPFQKAFTPTGSVSFQPVAIPLFKQKMDIQDVPDDLEETWLGFLAANSLDRKSWPFVRWLIEKHIIPKSIEDYEISEVYKGVYAAPTAGTAGAAGTAMDGIKAIINAHVTDDRITPIVTGAPNADAVTFVGQVEAFCKAIDARYRFAPGTIAMNKTLAQQFRQGMRLKYNMYYNQESDLNMVNDYNKKVVGLNSMGTSTKIWYTPIDNALVLRKKANLSKTVQVENVDRTVKLYSDWYKGVGFVIPEIVFTNDQELPS